MKTTVLVLVALAFAASAAGVVQESFAQQNELTAAEIIEKSQLAFYYEGDDMKAKVTMDLIDKDGGRRTRVLTMLRRDEGEGDDQKYFMYFHEPGDVRQMTFMVWKSPTEEDDRWVFIPAVDLIRRISADDKRSSFVGSDFTYEDVSGRDVGSDTHALEREEKLGDKECWVIRSIPKEAVDYTRRVSWIDKNTLLPLREEYYDRQDELYRVFTADKIEAATAGKDKDRKVFLTVTKRAMKNVKTGHRTEVTYTSVAYNSGLKSDDFSERHMRRPPRSWIQ